jgi:hypothetical protein
MKVEQHQNPSIFLVTYRNLPYKSGELKKNSTKSREFGSFFSMKNPLYRGDHIFQVEIWQKFASLITN